MARRLAPTNTNYYQLLQIQSSVNSSYNALAFQVDHRYQNGLSVLTNVTWSHAPGREPLRVDGCAQLYAADPSNPRSDYGNSATDVRVRYVGAVIFQPQTHFHGIENVALGGWRISPLVQVQTGLPYSPTISSTLKEVPPTTARASSTWPTPPQQQSGRLRLQLHTRPLDRPRQLQLPQDRGLRHASEQELLPAGAPPLRPEQRAPPGVLVELFNVMNHQNITGLTSEAYTLGSSGPAYTPS